MEIETSAMKGKYRKKWNDRPKYYDNRKKESGIVKSVGGGNIVENETIVLNITIIRGGGREGREKARVEWVMKLENGVG